MAGKVALGFSFFVLGDGTTDAVTVDLRTDPVYLFSVDPLTLNSQGSNPLNQRVSVGFDIIKTPPTGIILGQYVISGNCPVFQPATSTPGSGGDFDSPSVSGYQITVTPTIGFTNAQQCVGVLTFG